MVQSRLCTGPWESDAAQDSLAAERGDEPANEKEHRQWKEVALMGFGQEYLPRPKPSKRTPLESALQRL